MVDFLKWMIKMFLGLWVNFKYFYVFCYIEGEEEYLVYIMEEGNEMFRYNFKEVEYVVRNYKFIFEKLGVNVKK